MSLKFQYNKTSLQLLNKGLKVRLNALPTLIAKESALRLEVKKAREHVTIVKNRLSETYNRMQTTYRLWKEFPSGLVGVDYVSISIKKIAGVKTPILDDITFNIKRYSIHNAPAWLPEGIEMLKEIAQLHIEIELSRKKVDVLEYARKKTTQKVNLYEKVQIPEYHEAIRKIKRFMEDEDNLSKSSQKILKAKLAALEAA